MNTQQDPSPVHGDTSPAGTGGADAMEGAGWRFDPLGDIHELKTVAPFFDDVVSCRKTFEVRRHDRCFRPGDILHLREWRANTERYSGRECYVGVTYLLQGGQFGIDTGQCVLGITRPSLTLEGLSALSRATPAGDGGREALREKLSDAYDAGWNDYDTDARAEGFEGLHFDARSEGCANFLATLLALAQPVSAPPASARLERVRELMPLASPGEWFADMDRYRVMSQPVGNHFINDQRDVALCAVGEFAARNAALIATMHEYFREVFATPSPAPVTPGEAEPSVTDEVRSVEAELTAFAALEYVADHTYCGCDGEWRLKQGYDAQVVAGALAHGVV